MKNSRTLTVVIVLVIVGLLAFRLISNKKHIESKKQVSNKADAKVSVNIAPAQLRTSELHLTLVGTVTADQDLEVKSEVQGKIERLTFELGDYVTKGKSLAKIDDKIRQLSTQNAEQRVADAKQNLERYQKLFEGGAATKAQLEQYQLAYNNAKIQQEQAGKELSNTNVVAPISGYITTKNVEEGDFVNIGTALATIVDISKLKVTLAVPERDAYSLKTGDAVSITSSVYPGITFDGKIRFISYKGDAAHNYPVEISIVNQQKNPLKAGTYVDVAFNRQNERKTLQIPREALVGSVKDAQVYVVGSNSVAKLKPVTIAGDNGSYLEVSQGLSENEKVVTSGQINLNDGTEVAIINQ